MSNVVVPGTGDQQALARLVNRAVKEHRGKNQAFVCLVVNDDGSASVVSNMEDHNQKVRLMTECTKAMLEGLR